MENSLDSFRMHIEHSWKNVFDDEHVLDDCSVFFQSFKVQCVLASFSLPEENGGDVILRYAMNLPATINRNLAFGDTIEELLQSVTKKRRDIIHPNPSSNDAWRCDFDLPHVITIGYTILFVLQQTANYSKESVEGAEESVSAAHKEILLRVFNSISTLIADVMEEGDESNIYKRKNVAALSEQLILAPVCAAHLSLGCLLQQYDIVHHRISFLMGQNTSDFLYGTKAPNCFLYSDLLWSQLAQLYVCLPPYVGAECDDRLILGQSFATRGDDVTDKAEVDGLSKKQLPCEVIPRYLAHLGVMIRTFTPLTVGSNYSGDADNALTEHQS